MADSQLLSPQRLSAITTELNVKNPQPSAQAVAETLIKRKLISDYQAKILLAGHSGPFQYGNYTISDRSENESTAPVFRARHRSTRHPVLLEFFAGDKPADLDHWQQTEILIDQAREIDSPHLISLYESIVTADYRFVVSSRPLGNRLSERLPYQARMPWKNACLVFAQVAAALNTIHHQKMTHGAISPRTIWLAKNGLTQLQISLQPDPDFIMVDRALEGTDLLYHYQAPEWSSKNLTSPAMDVYALGCSLVRAITGRPLFEGQSVENIQQQHQSQPIPDFDKYDLPPELKTWILKLLAKNPEQRILKFGDLSKSLEALAGKSITSFASADAKSLPAYRESIRQFEPGQKKPIEFVPNIFTTDSDSASSNSGRNNVDLAPIFTGLDNPSKSRILDRPRKPNSRRLLAATTVGILFFLAAIGWWAMNAANQHVSVTDVAVQDPQVGQPEVVPNPEIKPLDPLAQKQLDVAKMPGPLRPIVFQQLIEDDGETLWETPTNGPPVELAGLPAAPKLIFIFRPADIVANPEGQRLIRSVGVEFEEKINQWQTQLGLDFSQIEQVIVSLHSRPDFTYEPFFVITPQPPLDIDHALQIWNRPQAVETESGNRFYISKNSDRAYCLLTGPTGSDPSDSAETTASVYRFAFGSKTLVAEVANNLGATILPAALSTMAEWTDQDRHINVLFLRTALFNDEGQRFMGERMRNFNRALSILIPDSVRGGMISLHLDEGTYFELMLDRDLDLNANDLKEQLREQMRAQRDRLTQFVATIAPSPYWDRVRLKYDNMLTDFFRNLRWGVEHQELVANAWLPPMAAHNLLAASELVIAFSSAGKKAATPVNIQPQIQNIAELLLTKRDLNIANPPDLNLLMADIEGEVNEDNPGLPFTFKIRLLGSDLQSEGITQNQRPTPLNVQQKSLADILTQIMTAANPSKDISGPADPNCKLVWVVADDPQAPGKLAVLITTRAAAEKKSYELPPAFRTE